MSIIRVEHSKENPYVVLNKKALEDNKLSWAAKGLWGYLLSRTDNWKIQVSQLSSIYKGKGGGEKAIYALLKELILNGYCIKETKRAEKGHYEKVEYVIYEFKLSLPLASQGDAVKRNAVNRHLSKEGVLLSNEREQQHKKVAKAPVVVSFSDEEKREEDADAAATQYINSEINKGNRVNETRIRKQALKERWKPNTELSGREMINSFKNGSLYEGKGGEFECIIDDLGIGFLPVDFYAPQPYTIYFKSKTFSKDFEKLLEKLQIKRP